MKMAVSSSGLIRLRLLKAR